MRERGESGTSGTYGGDNGNAYGILVGKPKGKNRYEDLGVDGCAILKWVLNSVEGRR